MKTSSAKAKARRLQNWTRDYMLKLTEGILTADDIRSAIMGEAGEDIKLTTKARQVFPFTFECKNTERLNIWDAYRQSEAHAEKVHHEPVVIFSRNRHRPLACIDAEYFLNMCRSLYDDRRV